MTIGGEFSNSDYFDNPKTTHSQVDRYFPIKIGESRRFFYMTGVDSLAAIIFEIQRERFHDDKIKLIFPLHYCHESISRLRVKLQKVFQIVEISLFETISDIPANFDGICIYLHFNRYTEAVRELKNKLDISGGIIVEDFVLAPFDISNLIGLYGFNSLRKFGLGSISVAYKRNIEARTIEANDSNYYNLKKNAQELKDRFVETNSEEKYLLMFENAELALADPELYLASLEEVSYLNNFDFDEILKIRRSNYLKLLQLCNSFHFKIIEGDYNFLIIKDDFGNGLRELLRKERIFCPRHWPDSLDSSFRNSLSVPIDQRISSKSISYLLEQIKNVFEKVG